MSQYRVDPSSPIYSTGAFQENPNSHPNPSRRQNFSLVNPLQDQQPQIQTKSCNGCSWSCNTLLMLCVAFVYILVSTLIAFVNGDMTTILFAIVAITISVFLCYGAICSRKQTLIAWLVFYGILLLMAATSSIRYNTKAHPSITPKHLKVRNNLPSYNTSVGSTE
jgi:hypothetical protein